MGPDGRLSAADRGHPHDKLRPVYFQSMSGIEQHVDWTAATTPAGERIGTGRAGGRAQPPPNTPREVMDTLLGKNNLSAMDVAGADPYNTTGRHFRR